MQLLRDNLTLDFRIRKHYRMWKTKICETYKSTRETISDRPRPSHPTPLGNSLIVTEKHQIWLLHLVSEFRFPSCWFSFFFNSFRKFLKARVNVCGFYWSQLLGSLRTLTGLHRGFFSITVLSPARCGKITIRMEITFIQKPLEFYVMQASKRKVNHSIEVYVVSFPLFLIV